jgi:hypothetical protein
MSTSTVAAIGPKLADFFSPAELEEIKAEFVQVGVPVRFLDNGRNLNIATGELMPKGVNVIYQTVYWQLARETANKIATRLGVRAVFSEG